ncbi:MAG: polysaccharide deacetylase family protein [Lachnospiraceae bacterium]|nr:polysaccharide deacetylase family protein [Lachnospiraceae bacterium]
MIKVTLSFDDGRKDNYRVANEILTPMQLPATFNITTDYVSGKEARGIPCANQAMNKEEVVNLSRNALFEIAGHGKSHHNGFDNLIDGIKELKEWCGLDKMGIASPNSQLSEKELQSETDSYRNNGICYVRTGVRCLHKTLVKKCLRKINKQVHSGKISSWVYRESLLSKEDNFILNSIPVLHYNTFGEVKRIINDAAKTDKSCILMFHSILKEEEEFYRDLWSWDYEQFRRLCVFLKEMEEEKMLQVCKTMDLVKDICEIGWKRGVTGV